MIILSIVILILLEQSIGYINPSINWESLRLQHLPAVEPWIREAIFRDNWIQEVEGLYYNVEVLDLSENRIQKIFWYAPNLVYFNVSKNPLKRVLLNATKLEIFDASYCSIVNLNEDFFFGIPNLSELYIQHNPLKTLSPNNLFLLKANHALLSSIPFMPRIQYIDISFNPKMETIFPIQSLRRLEASNCKIASAVLNEALQYLDVSANKITHLTINRELGELNVSSNLLRSIQLNGDFLLNVDLSNNFLSSVKITSRSIKVLNLTRNPLYELNIHCDSCYIDCSFCQIRKLITYNVDFLNLSYNHLEKIRTDNIRKVDLRHNLISEFTSDAEYFDVRHNALKDVKKISVTGSGYFSKNLLPCDCDTLNHIRSALKENSFCENDLILDKCDRNRKKSSVQPIVFGAIVFLVLLGLISGIKARVSSNRARNEVRRREEEREELERMNALPTYEEALAMAKPEWSRQEARQPRQETRQPTQDSRQPSD